MEKKSTKKSTSRKGIKNKAQKAVKLLRDRRVAHASDAMRLAGYSEESVKALSIGRTKEYQEYLKSIDDTAIVNQWVEHSDLEKATDKRLAFDMGKEIVKLKDRNPVNEKELGNMPILNMVFEGDVNVKPRD